VADGALWGARFSAECTPCVAERLTAEGGLLYHAPHDRVFVRRHGIPASLAAPLRERAERRRAFAARLSPMPVFAARFSAAPVSAAPVSAAPVSASAVSASSVWYLFAPFL